CALPISVLDAQGSQAALMSRMLELGRSQPLPANAKLPEELDIGIGRSNLCPLPGEFDDYARRNAHGGMPFAVTGLSDTEYATLQKWLEQGAEMDQQAIQPAVQERYHNEAGEYRINLKGA